MIREFEMVTSVRICLSYDLLDAISSPSNFFFISMKICIVVTYVVMTLLVPTENVM